MSALICSCCGDESGVHEVVFGFSGTHCTGGKAGNHYTGEYESDCCNAEMIESPLDMSERFDCDVYEGDAGKYLISKANGYATRLVCKTEFNLGEFDCRLDAMDAIIKHEEKYNESV